MPGAAGAFAQVSNRVEEACFGCRGNVEGRETLSQWFAQSIKFAVDAKSHHPQHELDAIDAPIVAVHQDRSLGKWVCLCHLTAHQERWEEADYADLSGTNTGARTGFADAFRYSIRR
jgi:hypothetical protein